MRRKLVLAAGLLVGLVGMGLAAPKADAAIWVRRPGPVVVRPGPVVVRPGPVVVRPAPVIRGGFTIIR
jgi:PXPV repeat (3 copies)